MGTVYWWIDDVRRDDTAFDQTLLDDYSLIKSDLGICVFHYGPALWRLGLTTQYDELEGPDPCPTLKYIVSRVRKGLLLQVQRFIELG